MAQWKHHRIITKNLCSSSMLFLCLFVVLVLDPSFVSNNCPTQWVSLFQVVCHMLEVKELLTTVLEELEWENINVAQWKH